MSIHIPPYHCHQSIVISTFNTVLNSPHVYPYTAVSLPLVHSYINFQHCAGFTTCLSIYRCITATSPQFYQLSTQCRIHHMSIHIPLYHCHQSIVLPTFNTVPDSPHVYPYTTVSLPLVHSFTNFQHSAEFTTCLSIYRRITATSPQFYQLSTQCRIHHMSIHIPPYHCHQSIVILTFNTVPNSPHVYPYTAVSLPLVHSYINFQHKCGIQHIMSVYPYPAISLPPVHSYINFQHSAEFTTCLSIYRRITATSPQFYQHSTLCRIHHMSIHIPPYHCHQSIVLSTFNTVPDSPHVYPYSAISLPLVHSFINFQHSAGFTTCLSIYQRITATSPQFYQHSTLCRIHHMSIHIPPYHCHQSIFLSTFNTVPNSPHVYPYTAVSLPLVHSFTNFQHSAGFTTCLSIYRRITATSPQFYQHSTLCRIHHMSIHIPPYHCHQSIVLSTFNTVPDSPHVYPYSAISLPLVHSFINFQHSAGFTTCLSIYRCITATSPQFYQLSTQCRIHHMSIHIPPYHCHQSIVLSTFNTVPNSPHVYPYTAVSLPLVHSFINFQHSAEFTTCLSIYRRITATSPQLY